MSHRTVPPNIDAYRGPNHILVSRRNSLSSLRSRVTKLLDSGRWDQVHVHGLGAAVGLTISLTAGLVEDSGGALLASASTSTEMLVDRDVQGDGVIRYNSALHVCLRKAVPS
jgi:hypothetical protein